MRQLPKKITYDWLVKHNACAAQRWDAAQLFGINPDDPDKGVTVNSRNLLKAARAGLSIDWLVMYGYGVNVYRRMDREVIRIRNDEPYDEPPESYQVYWTRVLIRDLKSGRLHLKD